MPTRRHFLLQGGAATAVCALGAYRVVRAEKPGADSLKPLRLLILGGTGFVGSYLVQAATGRGHEVAVFSRGKRDPVLPATVEQLFGDRNGDLASIKDREWDAVIDIPTYGPGWVRNLGVALRGRVKHYTFISTNAVYDNPAAHDSTNEESPVLIYDGSADPYTLTSPNGLREYGALKVLCEIEAERQFPGRTLVLRPGWIFGPQKLSPACIYWPARMEKGGEVLAAGDPLTPIQFVDVRDLAAWLIPMIEKRATGPYNVLGPATPTNLGQLVEAARKATSTASQSVTWVPSSWLAAQKNRELFGNILFWSHEAEGYAGMMRMSIQRALASGFVTRPMTETLVDTFSWFKQLPPEEQSKLLFARAPEEKDRAEKIAVPWATYLEREKQLLEAWRLGSEAGAG